MKARLLQTEFINRCIEKHQNKYDYSKTIFITTKKKINIICPKHGEFSQMANTHLKGAECKLCSNEKISVLYKSNTEDFIKKSLNIHKNRYDYSKTVYNGAHSKVKIICKIHGVFNQEPSNHLKGSGCPNCTYNIGNTEKFIKKSSLIHNNKYDYSLVKYTQNKKPVKIICPLHGVFEQTPDKHSNRKHGCPNCNLSKGELEIKNFLELNNISFIQQFCFKNCKHKLALPFDFYIPIYNLCIEFNGIQHYKAVAFFGGNSKLELQKKRDKKKQEYCKNNNIDLLTIKYNENVAKILSKKLLTH